MREEGKCRVLLKKEWFPNKREQLSFLGTRPTVLAAGVCLSPRGDPPYWKVGLAAAAEQRENFLLKTLKTLLFYSYLINVVCNEFANLFE